jgi:methylmalonyl-CoA/ethylmalonyl-CoA epimerase
MELKRLDHMAYRTWDIEPVVDYYTSKLGFKIVQKMELDFGGAKARSHVLQFPGAPFYIFVDMGLDQDNVITEWVNKYGSGLHHMAYLVDDIHAAAEKLRQKGMRFTTEQVVDTGGGLKQLFSHQHPITGMVTEIIQRYKDDVFFVQENVIQLIKSTKGF